MVANYLAFSVTPIDVLTADRTRIDIATGFLFRQDNGPVYLVTNWHIVTGRIPQTPSVSRRKGAVPVYATIKVHRTIKDRYFRPDETETLDIRLNDETGEHPTWLEHPALRNRADVVCIPLSKSQFDIDAPRAWRHLQETDLEVGFVPQVMQDAFVIGYPWGLTGGGPALPIFKRGSVASVPFVMQSGLPRFLIDCRTADGMSGSPVIGVSSGIWGRGEQITDTDIIGTVMGFIGVYSGRLEVQSEQLDRIEKAQTAISEIGIVWRPEVVTDIIANGVAGSRLSDMY